MGFSDSLYLVTNEDDKPIDFTFNRQSIVILPGKVSLVPFDAIVEKLGDPRSGPVSQKIIVDGQDVGRIAPRSWWINRLSVYYGTYDIANLELLKAAMPKVSVTTFDGEDPGFSFPVDDPECQYLMPTQSKGTSIEENLRREMAEMNRKMKAMERLMAQNNVPESRDDIPEDVPPAHVKAGKSSEPLSEAMHNLLRPGKG